MHSSRNGARMLGSMIDPFDLDAVKAREAGTQEEAKQRAEQTAADIKWFMGDARGRRFIHKLLATAGIYRSSMGPTSQDTAFAEGKRTVGLQVLGAVTATTPDEYLLMLKENLRAANV